MAKRVHKNQLFRARPDLHLVAQESAEGDRYTVKDPVSLEYYMLRRREYFLLRQLAHPQTVEQLRKSCLREFPGEEVTLDEVTRFCVMMHNCALITPEGAGQGAAMARRAAKGTPGRLAWLLSPLAIRLPGIDPTPVLRPLGWWGRVAFSLPFVVALLLAALCVVAGLLGNVEAFAADLAKLTHLAHPGYALSAVLALVLAKSWHELGHGLACRRFGGECHEMGVMLLAMMPCLYCDASDAWSFRRRWHRAAVALAGIYFELILAVAALAAWLVLAPGFLRVLSLHVAVISSVSSVLVNLNPLLRFDGYYLLSDAWGVSNLHEQSRRALWGPLERWISGDHRPEPPLDAPRATLAAYAVASLVQLTIVIATILWFTHKSLTEYGFRFAADTIVAVTLCGVAVRVLLALAKPLRGKRFHRRWAPWMRMGAVLSAITGAAWLGASLSVEQTLWSPCRLESNQLAHVTVRGPGELVESAHYNQQVQPGEVIARLEDPQQELRRLELQEQTADATVRLANLRTLAQRDAELFAEISVLETELAELRTQLQTLDREQAKLTLRSPIAGVLTRPPERAPRGDDEPQAWSGAPLDQENARCGVEAGDLLSVVAGGDLHAVVLLDQADSGLTSVGDRVRIALDRSPGDRLNGVVEEIALVESEDDRSRPVDSADVAIESALERPLNTSGAYRVRVRLEHAPGLSQHGALGQARIITGRETVAALLVRWVRQLFNFA